MKRIFIAILSVALFVACGSDADDDVTSTSDGGTTTNNNTSGGTTTTTTTTSDNNNSSNNNNIAPTITVEGMKVTVSNATGTLNTALIDEDLNGYASGADEINEEYCQARTDSGDTDDKIKKCMYIIPEGQLRYLDLTLHFEVSEDSCKYVEYRPYGYENWDSTADNSPNGPNCDVAQEEKPVECFGGPMTELEGFPATFSQIWTEDLDSLNATITHYSPVNNSFNLALPYMIANYGLTNVMDAYYADPYGNPRNTYKFGCYNIYWESVVEVQIDIADMDEENADWAGDATTGPNEDSPFDDADHPVDDFADWTDQGGGFPTD